MKRQYVYGVLCMVVLATGIRPHPAEPPGGSARLLINGSFDASPGGIDPLPEDMLPSWRVGTGAPRLHNGSDAGSHKGYMRMWGSSDNGETIYQMLGTPIRRGKSYRITASIRWHEQGTAYRPRNATVRFIAFNQIPNEEWRWSEETGRVAELGWMRTGDTSWQRYTTPIWRADASYHGFALNAENDARELGDSLNHSWIDVDDVELREVAIE